MVSPNKAHAYNEKFVGVQADQSLTVAQSSNRSCRAWPQIDESHVGTDVNPSDPVDWYGYPHKQCRSG